jgi:hypothetical protein
MAGLLTVFVCPYINEDERRNRILVPARGYFLRAIRHTRRGEDVITLAADDGGLNK